MRITELRERLTNTPLLPVMPVTSVRAAIEDIEQLTAMGVGVIEILLRDTAFHRARLLRARHRGLDLRLDLGALGGRQLDRKSVV